MKIVVCMASAMNNTERTVLKSFYDGVENYYFSTHETTSVQFLKKKHRIDLVLCYDQDIPPCDIAVQFGTTKDRSAEHHVTKQNIAKNAKRIIYIETPVLGRVIDHKNYYEFYRVGVDGFLNGTGKFFHEDHIDNSRLAKLVESGDVKEPMIWTENKKDKILLLGQLPGDGSLRGLKFGEWIADTVDQIRRVSEKTIDIRMHPGISNKGIQEIMTDAWPVLFKNHKKITWSLGSEIPLAKALTQCDVCVTYTSGSAVDAVLAGIPVVALDPGCLAYPVASHSLDEIDDPKKASPYLIKLWMTHLVNSQWNRWEMSSGQVWKHLLPVINESEE